MHRIDTANARPNQNGQDKSGFNDNVDLASVEATYFSPEWANAVQEEIAATIEQLGGTLDKNDNNQLATLLIGYVAKNVDLQQTNTDLANVNTQLNDKIAQDRSRLDALEARTFESVSVGQVVEFDRHFNTASEVSQFMGFGSWERALQGRVAVGFSDNASDPQDVRTFGAEFGEYEHQLTEEQMPKHAHQSVVALPSAANASYFESGTVQPTNIGHTLLNDTANSSDNQLVYPNDTWGHEGGDEAFDIAQPSRTVDKWKRIA